MGYAAAAAAARKHLEAGGLTSGLSEVFPVHMVRSRMTDEIARFESARLHTRQALANLAHAEGRPLADLARDWGVSRQYVWSLIQQVTSDSTPHDEAVDGPA